MVLSNKNFKSDDLIVGYLKKDFPNVLKFLLLATITPITLKVYMSISQIENNNWALPKVAIKTKWYVYYYKDSQFNL